MPPAEAPKSFARRDEMLSLQKKAQGKWAECKAFEVDAPEGEWDGGKFFVTTPYPYMNGKLHLGHAFTLSKAEFSSAYQRMCGKKVLFPYSWHCTGMPIQAAAFKLKNEYATYGQPLPNFPPSPPEVVELSAEAGSITIGWKAPTSTGGHRLTGFKVMLRSGAEGEYKEFAAVDAAGVAPGAQFSQCIDGLTVGEQYGFQVISVVEGAEGVGSKRLEKSADGKHPLALLAPKGGNDKGKDKGGKGGAPAKKPAAKIVAKTGGMMTQWDILISMGLSPEECVPFTDPVYWLKYFPPIGQKDLTAFGVGVDWRRSFITTDTNPFYDQFVRWQFRKLKEGDFIAFGKRPSIFSEADGQPCMDHDRDKGEGVGPQEYTALKIRILEPLPEVLKPLKEKAIYCLAATLRPETMAGQTNVWILPEGEYGCFEADGDQIYICAARAARNMSFQGIFPTWGSPKCVLTVSGQSLIGAKCKAPSTPYEAVYMLPLTTISMTKGTAIVTSVPSDSPDDYAAFMDLKGEGDKADKKRAHFGVKAEWINPFELIEIIETPDLGRRAAEFMCQKLKIVSQKDTEKLHEAHDIVYTAGYYKGVMLTGPCAGKPVIDAKPLCKKAMCDAGEAFTYLEPEGLVTPRSTPDVECVVALVDQWYLKYGQEQWAKAVGAHLEKLECYNPAVTKAFKDALGWLSDWACSRSFGLGTRMPWDETFLIESLSDSTIYMAYYLVAHVLQGGVHDGSEGSPYGIKPEQCDTAFWDAVMLGKPYVGEVPNELMTKMRREVSFWYPMDLRTSGRDLIPNHLTMCLYNHAAVWKDAPEMWPRGIYTNGFIQVDAEKMSKSKGNFLSLEQAIATWGSDATRFTCADAGDGMLNANYDRIVADRAILSLTTELEWIADSLRPAGSKSMKATGPAMRAAGAPAVWLDSWFANEMNIIVESAADKYQTMRFKEALKVSYYLMQEARDRYRAGTAHVGASEALIRQWAEWQALMMVPITPHWSEAIWDLLGKDGLAVKARWPKPTAAEKPEITSAGLYLFEVNHSLAVAMVNASKKKPAKGAPPAPLEKPNQVNLYVAQSFPRWKEIVLELLRAHFSEETCEVDIGVMTAIKEHAELSSFNKGKQVPQFAAMMREEAKTKGKAALALTMPFDELSILRDNEAYMCATLNLAAVHIYTGPAEATPQPDTFALAVPGKPAPCFFYDATIGRQPVAAAAPPAVPAAPPAAPSGPSQASKMSYLEKHGIAVALNEMVNGLAEEQPAEPYKWLAAKMQGLAKKPPSK
eukprot:CAMPEP_0174761884 /NCGR_PEP_ID=MMETSP1094-20130205/109498_1 /TAXON_ID=156173 /ORGANISM="Chrysochromulina brevifilum, Strain UTEX LB 985" /LENGTH=1269 /DNA_ID=CAMNT_0015967831 /DNA_START=53 /DNA_END=3862 /DNA_ORIENTATION=+